MRHLLTGYILCFQLPIRGHFVHRQLCILHPRDAEELVHARAADIGLVDRGIQYDRERWMDIECIVRVSSVLPIYLIHGQL